MKIWLVAVVLLAATSAGAAPKKAAKEAATKPTVDPNIDVAKVHGGKVWVMSDSIPTSEGGELAKWLTAHPANAELTCKNNEDRWAINFLAVFKKPPAKGPITVMLVDKKERESLSINSHRRHLAEPWSTRKATTWNRTTDSTRPHLRHPGGTAHQGQVPTLRKRRHHAQVADRDRGVGSSGFAVLRLHRLPPT